MRQHWGRYLLVGTLAVLVVVISLFWLSGGMSLVRLYREYLSQDIPDKKYSYQDFTDRGPRATLSGYYAGSFGNSIWMWTLSGLKRFTHQDGTSVYRYLDVCELAGQLAKQKETGATNDKLTSEPLLTFELSNWREWTKRGDYISVTRIEEERGIIIDKLWASSNYHYPHGGVTLTECLKR